jgi:hypothetical protein
MGRMFATILEIVKDLLLAVPIIAKMFKGPPQPITDEIKITTDIENEKQDAKDGKPPTW